jgi:hypothetical protein
MSDESANSSGIRGVTIAYDFECFDQLPALIRRALAHANNKYCSVQLYELWKNQTMTEHELVEELQTFERSLSKKLEQELRNPPIT